MSVKVHEAFSLDSFQDRLLWFDDFHGDQLQDEWNATLVATGTAAVVDAQTGGIVRFNCPAAGDSVILDWGTIRTLLVTKKVTAEWRVKTSVANADRDFIFYLRFNANNSIRLRILSTNNITLRTRDGGVITEVTSDQAVDTSYHVYRIECHTHTANHVHFYFDGVELNVSPITTNVPDDAADVLEPFIQGINVNPGAGGSIQYDIDYVYIRQER